MTEIQNEIDCRKMGDILSNLTAIHDLVSEGALFVANHSGGKDSQAMLINLLSIIPEANIIVVHAALGKEASGIYRESQIRSSHADRIYGIGIVIGSAAALGEVYKINFKAAQTISDIVSAPILLDSSSLLTDIATF